MSGWFAMSRAMFDHPIFAGNMERVGVWAWMVATAAWKDTRQDANGKTVVVKRGQLLTSYRQMSKATGVGIQSLRTLISRLQTEHAIDTDTNTGRLLITIRNYEKYQSADGKGNTGANTRPTQDQHTKEQENKDITLEANASKDAEASIEGVSILSKTLWDTAIRFLRMHGIDEAKARPIVGRWRKVADDAAILSALDACHRSGSRDPVPYITQAIKPEDAPRSASQLLAAMNGRI